ncbi:energy-coupling factor ABC transporter ATP-binding protein [Marinococcus halotolerans]|uniref:energy-coupling factor ABC transporter ATP-binding protein n=1 Tax=Marinococcus halotolerans TaxID=301092 RepID=UPI0003B5F99C|nr:ABC transporter ATP-binding protein [Marinococcus halotolerans]
MTNCFFDNVSYAYQDPTAPTLRHFTYDFSSSKTAILGANGSGKSTLLHLIDTLFEANEGTITIHHQQVHQRSAKAIRKHIGFVFDHPENQLFAPTVFEDIAFGPKNQGMSKQAVTKTVYEAASFMRITDLLDHSPYHLSLGQKKKTAMAGVIAMKPDMLLFDEPFSGLDPASLQTMIDTLNQLEQRGHQIILTTHDVDIAYQWADDFLLLKEGTLLAHGGTEVLENESMVQEANLKLPMLYRLFQHTAERPKTVEEARSYMFSEEGGPCV